MARPKGAKGRRKKDRSAYLKRFIRTYKRWRSLEGCAVCGETSERLLQFRYMNREATDFSISKAPGMAGMTLQRLKAGLRRTTLLCGECCRGMLCGQRQEDHTEKDALDLREYFEFHERVLREGYRNPKVIILDGQKFICTGEWEE